MKTRRALIWAAAAALSTLLTPACTPGIATAILLTRDDDDDDDTPPVIALVQPPDDSFGVGIQFTIQDPDSGTLSVMEIRWREVNGTRGGLITVTGVPTVGGSPSSAYPQVQSGVPVRVVWDSSIDVGPGNSQLVDVTLTVSDGVATSTVTSDPFLISNGPLGVSQQHATVGRPDGIAAGELTGDGLPDMITCSTSELDQRGAISFFLNRGQTFNSSTVLSSPDLPGLPAAAVPGNHFASAFTHPSECVLLDVDGDAVLDLVMADSPHGTWTFNDLVTSVQDSTSALNQALGAELALGFANLIAHQAIYTGPQLTTGGLELTGAWGSAQAAIANMAPTANPGTPLLGGNPTLDRIGWFAADLVAADLDPTPSLPATGATDLVLLQGLAQLGPYLALTAAPTNPFPPGAVLIRQINAAGQLGATFYLDPSVMGRLPVHCVVGDLTTDAHASAGPVGLTGAPTGTPDLVVANLGDSSLTFYLQTRAATTPGVDAPEFYGLNLPVEQIRQAADEVVDLTSLGLQAIPAGDTRTLAIGDVDQDGKKDLVVIGELTQVAFVLVQDPNPATPGSLLPRTGGAVPLRVAQVIPLPQELQIGRALLVDVDNDAALDLLIPGPQLNEVFLYSNTPGGTSVFRPLPARFTTSFQPFEVLAGDFNGDRRQDVTLGCIFGRDLSVLYQTTEGTLIRLADPVFTGSAPSLMASGDVTGDGVDAVVCHMAGLNQLHVFVSDPQQGLRLGRVYDLSQAVRYQSTPFSTAIAVLPSVGDATGDGVGDVLAAMEVGFDPGPPLVAAGALTLMTGPMDFSASDPAATPLPVDLALLGTFEPIGFSATTGDFLGNDGIPDLALSQPQGQGIDLYRGLGGGAFQDSTAASKLDLKGLPGAATLPSQVLVTDLDLDGQRDLVVGNSAAGAAQLLVYYGQGGALGSPTVIDTTGAVGQTFALAVADLGGPGNLPDVVLSGFNQPELGILFQTQPGVFVPVRLTTGNKPSQVVVGNLNDDSLLDVALVWQGEDKLAVYYQNPGANQQDLSDVFFGATVFDTPPQPLGTAIADLNQDGRDDLVISSRATNSLAIYLQR